MAKQLNLTSRVRAGMAVERESAEARLAKNDVAETARREAVNVIGKASEPTPSGRFKIKISEAVSNPYNPRSFYNAETIEGLARSFEQEGQLEPIKVTRLPEFPGKFVIIDGERRLRAGKSRGDEFIDAEICEETLEKQTLYLRAYSFRRRGCVEASARGRHISRIFGIGRRSWGGSVACK
jgi:ParB family transcriptional regulator, chromosome partitioning protein